MAKRKQTKQPKPRKQIKRTTRHFQLRTEHPKDAHVLEVLTYLKGQRREVTVIRDAIALYWALENNNLDVLFEMFPQHRDKLTGGDGGAGGNELAREIAAQIILQGGAPGLLMSGQPAAGTGKQLNAPQFQMPTFEELDDAPTVIISKSTVDSSMNFVNALKGMQ